MSSLNCYNPVSEPTTVPRMPVSESQNTAAGKCHMTILILLDLSAAFDTALSGVPALFIQQVTVHHSERLTLHNSTNQSWHPSGIHAWPCSLYHIHTSLWTNFMIPYHGLSFHCWWHNYTLAPNPPLSSHLVNCLQEKQTWMTTNHLKLNSNGGSTGATA